MLLSILEMKLFFWDIDRVYVIFKTNERFGFTGPMVMDDLFNIFLSDFFLEKKFFVLLIVGTKKSRKMTIILDLWVAKAGKSTLTTLIEDAA